MVLLRWLALLQAILLLSGPGLAGTSTQPAGANAVRVAAFAGDKKAAVTFTFDDGTADHVALAAPLLEEFGYRGTFLIVTGSVNRDKKSDPAPAPKPDPKARSGAAGKPAPPLRPNWEEWKALAERGHEIGSHGMTHMNLKGVTDANQLEKEVAAAGRLIESKIGRAAVSYAYPFYGSNPTAKKFVLARHALDRGYLPCYGNADFTAAGAQKYIDDALSKGTWHVALVHGLSAAEEWRNHLGAIQEHGKDIWVDTYANVGRYVRQRDAATLTVLDQPKDGKASLRLELPESMAAAVWNVPLTVVVAAEKAASASASRTGTDGKVERLPASVADGKVLVDVVPGAGVVTVQWK